MLYYETDYDYVPTLKRAMKFHVVIRGGIRVCRKERKGKEKVTLLNLYDMYINFQRVPTFY